MKRLLAAAIAVFATFASSLRAALDPDTAPIVIMVSIDGLAAYNLTDPTTDLPTIRWMAEHGAQAERMESSFPSVTWPTHTALVTGVSPGRHGVLANAYYDRAQKKKIPLIVDPIFEKEQLVKVPTVYDVAHDAGLRTAGVCWPASRAAKKLDWQIPDMSDQALFEKSATPSLLAELKAKNIPYGKQGEWAKAGNVSKAMRDWMYTRIAEHLLRTHRPNLLVIHLVTVDAFAHTNGGHSPEVKWAGNDNDHRIRELMECVQSTGLAARTTIIVTADHGFADFSKNINPSVILREKGWLGGGAGGAGGKVTFLSEGGAGMFYIRDAADRAAITAELVPRLRATEGVEMVFPASEYASIGHVSPDQDPREPDIFVAAKEGYAFGENAASKELITPAGSTKGTHGNWNQNPALDATFVAWGAAIKPGTKLGRIRNVDVAPSIAAILGVKMENVEGRVLRGMLKE